MRPEFDSVFRRTFLQAGGTFASPRLPSGGFISVGEIAEANGSSAVDTNGSRDCKPPWGGLPVDAIFVSPGRSDPRSVGPLNWGRNSDAGVSGVRS